MNKICDWDFLNIANESIKRQPGGQNIFPHHGEDMIDNGNQLEGIRGIFHLASHGGGSQQALFYLLIPSPLAVNGVLLATWA
jgi:hypothetical protein